LAVDNRGRAGDWTTFQNKLNAATDTHCLLGIFGESTAAQLAEWFPLLPSAPYELASTAAGILLRVADAHGVARYQWIANKGLADQVWPSLMTKLPILPEHSWARTEIQAGIPHISLATQEKFVPQMINYELIGAVNFKKGCYPGQEIVARSQYLGKQKRRMVLAHIDNTNVRSGMEVFAGADLDQPCGMIVNAELNDAGGSDCLIEIKTAYLHNSAEHGSVKLSSGEICHWLPMPYPLPDDATTTTNNSPI